MKVFVWIALACFLSATLVLSGCGGGDSSDEGSEARDENPSKTDADVDLVSSASKSLPTSDDDDFNPPGFKDDGLKREARTKVARAPKKPAVESPKKEKAVFVSADQLLEKFGDGSPKRKVVVHNYSDGSKRYDGRYKEWWANRQLWKEGTYKDNRRVGEWKWWNRDGKVSRTAVFVADKPDRESLFYFDDGSLSRRESWNEGKRQGPTVTFHKGGKQKETEVNWENDERQGLSQQWYEDGKLKAKFEFLSNEPHGTLEEWYENGQQKNKRTFRNGKRHGLSVEWDEEGEEVVNEQFEDGERVR